MASAKLCPECGEQWNGVLCGDAPAAGQMCACMPTEDSRRCRVCGSAATRKPAGAGARALGVTLALPVLAVTAGVAAIIFWLTLSGLHSVISWHQISALSQGDGYQAEWHLCGSDLLMVLAAGLLALMVVSYAVRMNK